MKNIYVLLFVACVLNIGCSGFSPTKTPIQMPSTFVQAQTQKTFAQQMNEQYQQERQNCVTRINNNKNKLRQLIREYNDIQAYQYRYVYAENNYGVQTSYRTQDMSVSKRMQEINSVIWYTESQIAQDENTIRSNTVMR